MAYINITSQLVSAASASKTFSVSFTVQNYDNAAVEFSWTSVTGVSGFVTLYGSVTGSNYSTLTASPSTMTTSTSSYLFNITDTAYNWILAEYSPSGNSAGTVNLSITRKSRR